MSQKPIERLRHYLGQLPPQSQAMLMREFERAIERGEDVAVATLVLEQLRMMVRGSEDNRPRTGDLARLFFQPLDPFLVDGSAAVRPGQIRRASLSPIWLWVVREGAPEAAHDYETMMATTRDPEASREVDKAVRRLQLAAAESILKIAGPGHGDNQRALARVGAPDVVEDLLPIGSVLKAREGLDGLVSRLPRYVQAFGDAQIAAVNEALNVPSLQTPQLLPFALSLVMQRLTAPWQIIRLAVRMAASDDEVRVAATPYGTAVTIALHDLAHLAAALRMDIRRSHFTNVAENLKSLHDGIRGL